MNRKHLMLPPAQIVTPSSEQAKILFGKAADMIMLDEPATFSFKFDPSNMTLQMAYDAGPFLHDAPKLSTLNATITGKFADTPPVFAKPAKCGAVFGYTTKYECQLRKGHDPSAGYKQYGHWNEQIGPPKPPAPPKYREMG